MPVATENFQIETTNNPLRTDFPEISTRISQKIEQCRLALGMTQTEFAKYMHVSQTMISNWESKKYNFTIRSLSEIAEKLGHPISFFLN